MNATLSLTGINYTINHKQIFKDFEHTFEKNSITPIIGASGCGKSTLINIAAGLLKPQSGRVFIHIFDEDVSEGYTVTKPSDKIMIMNQTYTNFPWVNCFENALFHYRFHGTRTKEAEEEAAEVLHQVGLGNYLHRYPSSLSGGMRQRLALARVICAKAPIVFMDEPLSALDDTTRTVMQDLLLKHQKDTKCTMGIITHNNAEAELLKVNSEILVLPKE